jgi:transcriptional regulator with XRE-family HTH domain
MSAPPRGWTSNRDSGLSKNQILTADLMDLVTWIRDGLAVTGKSRLGLARALGLPASVITRMLQGKRRVQVEELPVIADYIGCPVPAWNEWATTPQAPSTNVVRLPVYHVEPRDVPARVAARRLHLSEQEFETKKPALFARGFPTPDITTGMYDLKMIDEWMDRRRTQQASQSTAIIEPRRREQTEQPAPNAPLDPSVDFERRMKMLSWEIQKRKFQTRKRRKKRRTRT